MIEVIAAGRRGSETPISSQPSTCEVSASVISQPALGQAGREVVGAEGQADGERDDGGHERHVEQRARRAAQVIGALALDEQERCVGEAGGDAEGARRAPGWRRTRPLEHAGDEQDAEAGRAAARGGCRAAPRSPSSAQREERHDDDLQVAEHGGQPGADVARSRSARR